MRVVVPLRGVLDAARRHNWRQPRVAGHATALVAAAVLVVLGSAFTPARLDSVSSSTLAQTAASQVATPPDWLRAPGSTRLVFPESVRTTDATGFWSGPDERALLFSVLPTGVTLKPMGVFDNGRMLVYYTGDADRVAGQAWCDVAALEPASAVPGSIAQAQPQAPSQSQASSGPAELALKPIVAPPVRTGTTPAPLVTAMHVAVLDETSGALLYAEKPFDRVAPASVTKIAATIVALEQGVPLDRVFTSSVSAMEMVNRDGSSVMGLEPGEKVSLATLLYGMMLPSGNDAAEQVAISLGGTRERYVGMMNDKVQSLGLADTHFVTPSGMDAPGHYSTAYDMALLTRYAMRNESFQKMAGAQTYVGDDYVLKNANRLIGYYAGADGVKIGFTDNARKTIVATATRDGHRVYVSLMRSEDLVSDSIALFEWVWENFRWP